MFFFVSKIVWVLITPSNALALTLALGAALAFSRYHRLARILLGIGLVAVVVVAATPLPKFLVGILEKRFSQTSPSDVAGIVVLGGNVKIISDQLHLTEAIGRLIAAVQIARRNPSAIVVFSGGDASITPAGKSEADAARAFFEAVGFETSRVIFEGQSRNTRENALFTRALVHPERGARWLLITSAYHMPRAVGSFRAVGLELLPHPVGFTFGPGEHSFFPFESFAASVQTTDRAAREWIGLLIYWAAGYIPELFPGPSGGERGQHAASADELN